MQISESLLRDALRLIIWYPFRWLVLLLPPMVAMRCITALGDIHYALSPNKRRVLYDNLLRMKPHASSELLQREARMYLRVHYLNQLIIFVFPSLNETRLNNILHWKGLQHLHQAIAQGRGVVLVHPHFGPVHLPLFALGTQGFNIKQIGNPSARGLSWIGRHVAFRLRLHYESKIPAEIIPVGKDYRDVFKHLRAGGLLMITGDGTGNEQEFGRHVSLELCGQTLRFPTGPASLALRTNSILMPLFLHPGKTTLWECQLETPIEIAQNVEPHKAICDATNEFVQRYEEYVKNWPGCMHFLDGYAPGKLIEKQ